MGWKRIGIATCIGLLDETAKLAEILEDQARVLKLVASHPVAIRSVSGLLLVALGAVLLSRGMLFAGM
jgi:hypothetical protein